MVKHLLKMVNIFYKNHFEKLKAILVPLDFAPPIAKPTVRFLIKQKQKCLAKGTIKHAKE